MPLTNQLGKNQLGRSLLEKMWVDLQGPVVAQTPGLLTASTSRRNHRHWALYRDLGENLRFFLRRENSREEG